MRWWISIVFCMAGGCSFFTPGYDTRQAFLAKNHMDWRADGSATVTDETTHNGTTLLFESAHEEGAEVTLNPEGMPIVKGASGLFYRKTDPDNVGTAYMKLAEENSRAWSATMAAVLTAMQQSYDYRLQRLPIDNAADASRTESRLAAIERILDRLVPATRPE